MSRLVEQPITGMTLDARRYPRTCTCQGRRWQVQRVVEAWQDAGAWWEGEEEKTFWRVVVSGGGIVELYQTKKGDWSLYRIWD
jgi:hypothetical protein